MNTMIISFAMRFILLFSLLLVLGCIKEVNIEPLHHSRKIVINSLFQPDSIMLIHVSLSSIFNNTPQDIENAIIDLYKNDILLNPPVHKGGGWYNTFHYPAESVHYRVVVKVTGHDSVWAETTVPGFPHFTQMPVCKKIGSMVIDGDKKIVYDTHLSFLDVLAASNFYEVYFGKNNIGFKIHDQTDPSLLMDSDLDLFPEIPSLIFSDVLFAEQEKQLIINGLGSVFDFSDEFPFLEPEIKPFNIVFHSVSKEYFDFRKRSNRHYFLQNTYSHYDDPIELLFKGNPIEMYSNVNGGLGVFAAYSGKILEVNYEE
jgi:hypothetical protein